MAENPCTLLEAIKYFADPDVSHQTLVELRWPNGVCCPTCGRIDVRFIASRRLWECKEKHPKKQFSARVGTLFEDSPLGLGIWFAAIWQIANCKNGISSYEFARAAGITQKSAWFVLHRVRRAMEAGSIELDGTIEADETYLGGAAKNMHQRSKRRKETFGPTAGKQMVVGILRRKTGKRPSKVKATHVPDTKKATLQRAVRETAAPGSTLYTDNNAAYDGLASEYQHDVINHALEFVRGAVHTNGIENFWSLFKRTVKGTYISVEPAHLQAYLAEQSFRFNERTDDDFGRFRKVLGSIFGKRLTYKELTDLEKTASA
ncbi:MAG: IS1595 family transposase [Alphaproteobacteria bacterium]|nr:IS1595 family transposase [Alphaproteobacteria bacterium]